VDHTYVDTKAQWKIFLMHLTSGKHLMLSKCICMMSRPDKNYRYFVPLVLQCVVLRRILKNTPCGFSFNVYSYFISLGKNLTI
jgi:hypothetical protein